MIPLEDVDCINTATGLGLTQIGADVDGKNCSCSAVGSKKRVWEASYTSLKSKKVKGGHLSYWELDSQNVTTYCPVDGSSLITSRNESLIDVAPRGPLTRTCVENMAENRAVTNFTSQEHGNEELLPRSKCLRIMLMNIADDAKQSHLIKVCSDIYFIYHKLMSSKIMVHHSLCEVLFSQVKFNISTRLFHMNVGSTYYHVRENLWICHFYLSGEYHFYFWK